MNLAPAFLMFGFYGIFILYRFKTIYTNLHYVFSLKRGRENRYYSVKMEIFQISLNCFSTVHKSIKYFQKKSNTAEKRLLVAVGMDLD